MPRRCDLSWRSDAILIVRVTMAAFPMTTLLLLVVVGVVGATATVRDGAQGRAAAQLSRRASVLGLLALPAAALASKDCFEGCNENCAREAPSSLPYCKSACSEYCSQPGVDQDVTEAGDDYSSPGERFLSAAIRSALKVGQVQLPGLARQDAVQLSEPLR